MHEKRNWLGTISIVISIAALLASIRIGCNQRRISERQTDISQKQFKLSKDRFRFYEKERTKPLQGKLLTQFYNVNTYFAFGGTKNEKIGLPNPTVLKYAKQIEKMDRATGWPEEGNYSELAIKKKEIINKFLQEISRKGEESKLELKEDGTLHYTLSIQLFNPRDMKITISSISYNFAAYRKYCKQAGIEDWYILPTPDVEPKIYVISSDRKVIKDKFPFSIDAKETKYLIVSFHAENILEIVSNELCKKDTAFQNTRKRMESYLTLLSMFNVDVHYEDKKITLDNPVSGKPMPEFFIVQLGYPWFRKGL